MTIWDCRTCLITDLMVNCTENPEPIKIEENRGAHMSIKTHSASLLETFVLHLRLRNDFTLFEVKVGNGPQREEESKTCLASSPSNK